MFIGLLLINLGFDEIANPRLRQIIAVGIDKSK